MISKELISFFNEFDIKLENDNVLNFIEIFKGIDETTRAIIEEIYSHGDCGRFHFILKTVFPEAQPFVFKGRFAMHVISKIGDNYYDIEGICTFDRFKNIDSYKELLKDKKTLEESIRLINTEDLLENDLFNNYCFESRGPIL